MLSADPQLFMRVMARPLADNTDGFFILLLSEPMRISPPPLAAASFSTTLPPAENTQKWGRIKKTGHYVIKKK